MMYSRVFLQILDSSLAENYQTRHVFEDLLKLAEDGVVDMTREAIARRTNVPFEVVDAAITALEGTDPASRDPAEDGRRLVRLDEHRNWGWRIVNWAKYEAIKKLEHKREVTRKRVERFRKGVNVTPCNAPVTPCNLPPFSPPHPPYIPPQTTPTPTPEGNALKRIEASPALHPVTDQADGPDGRSVQEGIGGVWSVGRSVEQLAESITPKTRTFVPPTVQQLQHIIACRKPYLAQHAEAVHELGVKQGWRHANGRTLGNIQAWALAVANGIEKSRRQA